MARNDAPQLMHAVEFCFEKSLSSAADVTLDTPDLGMRRCLVSCELGLHWDVACLAAECYRFGIFIRPETAKSGDKKKRERDEDKGSELPATRLIVEVEDRERLDIVRMHRKPAAAFKQSSDYGHENSKDQNARHEDKRDQIGVWIVDGIGKVEQQQQKDAGEGSGRDQKSDVANIVSKESRGLFYGFVLCRLGDGFIC